ncbi:hypothetical protein B0H19DRAFT_1059940 [Mycena capillaripes]|nr:hypothetical protein B0H19DRAFT_1059940 [Mycena capillaripes]
MRYVSVALQILLGAALVGPAYGRRSRLVTRGLELDLVRPLVTAGTTNGPGQGLTQCPISTTACARHRRRHEQDDDDDGELEPDAAKAGSPTPTTTPATSFDCIDTDVDFRSCGGCRFPRKGQDKGEDCTQIEGVAEAACECGVCVVRSCRPGYVLDDTSNAFCAWHGIVPAGDIDTTIPKEEGSGWWWWFL